LPASQTPERDRQAQREQDHVAWLQMTSPSIKSYTLLTPSLHTWVWFNFLPYEISTNSCFQLDSIHRRTGDLDQWEGIMNIIHTNSGGGNK
jgi:hypothetical protein